MDTARGSGAPVACTASAWVVPEDPFELIAKALGPPWEGPVATQLRFLPVQWQRQPPVAIVGPCPPPEPLDPEHRTGAGSADSAGSDRTVPGAGSMWQHDVVRCPRSDNDCILVHRFTLGAVVADRINARLVELAASELRKAGGAETDYQASNVGGHHSSRNLFAWPSVQATGLAVLISAAVDAVVASEAQANSAQGRATDATGTRPAVEVDEAWLNVLEAGGWNTLCVLPCHPATYGEGTHCSASCVGRPHDSSMVCNHLQAYTSRVCLQWRLLCQ